VFERFTYNESSYDLLFKVEGSDYEFDISYSDFMCMEDDYAHSGDQEMMGVF